MKPNPADTPVSSELVKALVAFHGHLGPFLVLGAKAGLLANSLLGKDYFKTKAIVMTNPSPPNSCFVDGVQFTTGCTMGKGNIKLRKGKDVSVLFSKDGKKLRLKLKKEMLKSIESISSEEATKEASLNLLNRSAYELFEIKR